MTTPVPRIWIALDGKVDFVRATNPWGGSEAEGGRKEKPPIEDVNEAERSLMQWANQVNAGRGSRSKGR